MMLYNCIRGKSVCSLIKLLLSHQLHEVRRNITDNEDINETSTRIKITGIS